MRPTAMPSNLSRSLNRALVVVLAAGVLLAAIELALLPLDQPSLPVLVGLPLVFLIYVCAGVIAWRRRPSNRMGPLILLGGVAVYLVGLQNTSVPVLAAAGLVGSTLVLAVIVHLLHAFPSGTLRSRLSRWTVAAAYANSLILQAPLYLFGPFGHGSLLFVADVPSVAEAASALQTVVGFGIMCATAFVLIRRLVVAAPGQRRVLALLYGYGAVAALAMSVIAGVVGRALQMPPAVVGGLQLIFIAGVPIAFTAAALRGGFARTGELEELGSWLGASGGARPSLSDALSRALGDPSLELWFRMPRSESYVNEHGDTADAAQVDARDAVPGRGAVAIELAGEPIATISYDATLIGDPETVRTAGRVIAIAADRERLIAELRVNRSELRDSRERVLDARDQERERLARDLHDGLQVQLVLLAINAQQLAGESATPAPVAARATQLRKEIDAAASDLRRLAHAVMPAALVQHGLAAATEDLVDRMPIPTTLELGIEDGECSAAVERTAYFVVAEALTNAIKHADATRATVRLVRLDGQLEIEVEDDGVGGAAWNRGSGLRGLADRVDVLGGRMHLTSDPGAGTRIVVELPCAS